MSDTADRYRTVAAGFSRCVDAVPVDAWDRPSPCEGWTARDVVGHLLEWLPSFFFGRWDLSAPDLPSVTEDPAAAWHALDGALQGALDDPAVADAVQDTPMGPMTFEQALDMICTSDVLVHTWDLARATGLDAALDADAVGRIVAGMEPMDQALRESGHYGPRVPVSDGADDQTKLLAFMGRKV